MSGEQAPELGAAARHGVEAALAAGAADSEAFVKESRGREIRVHDREVESLAAESERGIGIRAWIGGRVGYAFGTDLSAGGVDAVAAAASEGARVADEDEHAAAPGEPGEGPAVPGLHDPSLAEWPTPRAIDLALEIERAALDADRRIAGVEVTVYADSEDRVAIASSSRRGGEYESSTAFAYLQALAADGNGRETGLGFGMGRSPAALDPGAIGHEAADRAVAMIGARKPESRASPVVFDPTVAASFLGLIAGALEADSVQRGRSPFASLLGEEVGSPALTLHDDGTDPAGLASSPVDDEGTPRRRLALIEGARLRSFLHDSYTARRGGTRSTASAGRAGYRSPPSPAASNLVVEPGDGDLHELFGAAGDGVYVTEVAGLHSGVNPVSGVFSVGASGRAIVAGAPAEPLREFTIASDLVSMLGTVERVGSEPRWVPFGGSVRTPPLLIAEMSIGGV